MENTFIILVNGKVIKETTNHFCVKQMKDFLSGFYPFADFQSGYTLANKSIVLCYTSHNRPESSSK